MTKQRPYGGKLVNRILSERKRKKLLEEAKEMPKIRTDLDTIMDAEKIAIGAYSPLEGFMNQEDYREVLYNMRLANGLPWTMPIIFAPRGKDNESVMSHLREGEDIILDYSGKPFAMLHLDEKFELEKGELASMVYGTTDKNHPNVGDIYKMGKIILAGKIDLIQRLNTRFAEYELTPLETRRIFREKGWSTIAGYQCRNPPHGAHEYIQRCALELVDGLFIHPVVGRLKKDDYKPEIILRAYEILIEGYYPKDRVLLASLSITMRYGGPRAAIFLAIIRRNFGCTHFILGRDIAGVNDYYDPYAAHKIFDDFDLGIEPIKFCETFYCEKCGSYASAKTCSHTVWNRISVSQTKIREMLRNGERIPPNIVRPEIAEIMKIHKL